MRRPILLLLLAMCAARTALAVTCDGFSIVPADHVIVKYSTPLPTGATLTPAAVSLLGTDITVSRNVSGGSAVNVACVDDRLDLGILGAGRYNLAWTDNVSFTSQRSSFTFFVGAPATGTLDKTSVLLPLLPDQPVRLEVNACSQRPAVAYRSGNDIAISQYGSGSACKLYLLDLGLLPAGIYNVKTTRLDATTEPSSTSFSFVVQQPAATSACNGTFSVTRTERGTARLRYEDSYRGAAPIFGLPAVTEISTWTYSQLSWPLTQVVQPVADTAKFAPGIGAAICHAEDLEIAAPAEGYNEVQWYDQVIVNGADTGFVTTYPVGFWWHDGRMQCSAIPRAISPSVAIEGQPVHLALSVTADDEYLVKTTVVGRLITLDRVPYPFEHATPGYPYPCDTYDAILNALPAGDYTVLWRGFSHDVITSAFTVAKPARIRAARH